jgi:hypothetical protein
VLEFQAVRLSRIVMVFVEGQLFWTHAMFAAAMVAHAVRQEHPCAVAAAWVMFLKSLFAVMVVVLVKPAFQMLVEQTAKLFLILVWVWIVMTVIHVLMMLAVQVLALMLTMVLAILVRPWTAMTVIHALMTLVLWGLVLIRIMVLVAVFLIVHQLVVVEVMDVAVLARELADLNSSKAETLESMMQQMQLA